MDNREKILEATARVYAEFGYGGATTRRIADAAGVNEVTLFRRFGSKSALIEEALKFHAMSRQFPRLPAEPVDPVREVTAWCYEQIAQLKEARAFFRKFMCDMQQHPSMRAAIMAIPHFADDSVRAYVTRLGELGLADTDFDAVAAVQMLRGAIFGDVMGRDLAPGRFPQPEQSAPALYAKLFLRAIGVDTGRTGAVGPEGGPSGAGAPEAGVSGTGAPEGETREAGASAAGGSRRTKRTQRDD